MINQDKWINSLPNISKKNNIENALVDHDRWVSTISKQKTYNVVTKYSLLHRGKLNQEQRSRVETLANNLYF